MKPGSVADKLGQVKAQISELEQKEEELRQMLIDFGIPEVEGRTYRALVIQSEVTKVDYKGICEEVKVPPKVLKAHTEVQDRTTVKIVART